jgi:hypothetical protein
VHPIGPETKIHIHIKHADCSCIIVVVLLLFLLPVMCISDDEFKVITEMVEDLDINPFRLQASIIN